MGEIVAAAKQKDAGVDDSDAAEIVMGFPPELFDEIKWRSRPDFKAFFADLQVLARNILESGRNDLFEPQKPGS